MMGRSGENGDGGMERKVGLNGVGWMRRWLLLRVWVCDIFGVIFSGQCSICAGMFVRGKTCFCRMRKVLLCFRSEVF